jgi:hypothetical protein
MAFTLSTRKKAEDYPDVNLSLFLNLFLERKGFWSQNATFFIDD